MDHKIENDEARLGMKNKLEQWNTPQMKSGFNWYESQIIKIIRRLIREVMQIEISIEKHLLAQINLNTNGLSKIFDWCQ